MAGPELWCWRHPRAVGAAARCIGSTDLAVDRRRAKRLAHRIRAAARAQGLPREVSVSPLRRSLAVGRWLRRWGWRLVVDARLREMDFGRWDGRLWEQIAWDEVQAWQADLLRHRPGGGESLLALAQRVQAFVAAQRGAVLVVTHGGWINALRQLPVEATAAAGDALDALDAVDSVDAARWPAAPPHGTLTRWPPPGD